MLSQSPSKKLPTLGGRTITNKRKACFNTGLFQQRKTAAIAAAVLVCLLEPERIIVEDDEDDIENPADGTTKENPENR